MSPWIGSALLFLTANAPRAVPAGRCELIAASIRPTNVPDCVRKQSYARAGRIGSANRIAEEVVAACRAPISAKAQATADTKSPEGTDQAVPLRSIRAEARRLAFYKVVQARAGRCAA